MSLILYINQTQTKTKTNENDRKSRKKDISGVGSLGHKNTTGDSNVSGVK